MRLPKEIPASSKEKFSITLDLKKGITKRNVQFSFKDQRCDLPFYYEFSNPDIQKESKFNLIFVNFSES
jgi:hypothetical protein